MLIRIIHKIIIYTQWKHDEVEERSASDLVWVGGGGRLKFKAPVVRLAMAWRMDN